ncbi:MAG: GAF domain-containing protein, partial [Bacteroidota bacterium]
MAENQEHLSLGIPRHAHLLDWIEERKTKQGFETLSDYFNSIKTDIEEALTLIDGVERYSPSSISQLLQVSKDKNFPIPVMIHQDQKIAFINHAAEDMAGIEFAKSVIGQSIFSYLPVADHPKMMERMGYLMNTGVSADPVKQTILLPGGGEIEVMLYGFLTTYQARPAIQILFWELEEDLRELREKQEQLRVSECLNDALLLLISDEEEEKVFPELLKIACSGFRADKVKLFQNFTGQHNALFGRHMHEWSEITKSYHPRDERYQFFYYQQYGFSRWEEILSAGDCIAEPVSHMPDSEQAVLLPVNIYSVLAAPIVVDQQFWGFISVDDCQNPRHWTTFEQSILKSLGLAISGYIQRRQSSRRTFEAEKAMHKAQEIG